MNLSKKHLLIGIAVILILVILKLFLPQEETFITEKTTEEEKENYIYVHIDGAVQNPGIKEVKEGTRVFELLELAGGELEEADVSRLNLASVLKDEQKIIVPYKVSEEENGTIQNLSYNSSVKSTSKIININYANAQELQTLQGIGRSMAQKIIDFRNENGLFNSI